MWGQEPWGQELLVERANLTWEKEPPARDWARWSLSSTSSRGHIISGIVHDRTVEPGKSGKWRSVVAILVIGRIRGSHGFHTAIDIDLCIKIQHLNESPTEKIGARWKCHYSSAVEGIIFPPFWHFVAYEFWKLQDIKINEKMRRLKAIMLHPRVEWMMKWYQQVKFMSKGICIHIAETVSGISSPW